MTEREKFLGAIALMMHNARVMGGFLTSPYASHSTTTIVFWPPVRAE